METTPETLELAANFFHALGNRNRLLVLIRFYEGADLEEVLEESEISRGGMQGHIDKLLYAGLIRKLEEQEQYEITNYGERSVEWILPELEEIIEVQSVMDEVEEELDQKEEKVREGMPAMEGFGMELSESKLGRVKRRMVWELAKEDIDRIIKNG